MKYNININQLALNEIAPGLNLTDAAVLDYLVVFCNSKSDKIDEQRIKEDNEIFTWVDLGTLLQEMPLLNISSRSALIPRFKKLKENNFIDIKRKRIDGHFRLFIKLNSKIDSLFTKLNRPVHETEQDPPFPVHETEPIINTTNTYNNTNIPAIKEDIDYSAAFMKFWVMFPKKENKYKAFEAFNKVDPKYHQQMLKTLDHQIKTNIWSEYKWIPQASTWLNQKRWEDEIPTNAVDAAMETFARELARQFDPEVAEFKFTAKYKIDNLPKVRHILGL